MSNSLPPPPERPGLGSTFKRPISKLVVGNESGPGFVIDSTVPAILQTFYTTAGLTLIQVSLRAINSAGDYYYEVVGAAADNRVFVAEGVVYVSTSSVVETQRDGVANATTPHTTFNLLNRTGNDIQATVGQGGGLAWASPPGVTSWWVFNFPVIAYFRGVDIFYDQISQSRGIVAVGTATASVSGIATVLTQILITDTKGIFDDQRAYRLHVHIPLVVSVAAGDVIVRWKQTNGTVIRPQQTWWRTLANGSIVPYDETLVFVNTSGAAFTNQDIIIEVATTGTANLASSVSATAPGRFEIEDIGAASRFPNAPSMA